MKPEDIHNAKYEETFAGRMKKVTTAYRFGSINFDEVLVFCGGEVLQGPDLSKVAMSLENISMQ